MKIGIQGEIGAYSEAAARQLQGSKPKIVCFEYFEEVFRAVKSGAVNIGVIPIENSSAGSIHQNYDLLLEHKLHITGETFLRVEHVLMCHPNASLKSLNEVRSHAQALAQCSGLFKKYKKLKPIAFYDTAGSAKYVAEGDSTKVGAIASLHAAQNYGLKILKRNVENNSNNYTRFLQISKTPFRKNPVGATVKSSISFAPLNNESGVLFKMLGVFAFRNISLLKIESRPWPQKAFDYVFYLDFEGHPTDSKIKSALEHLKEFSSEYHFYGSYIAGKIKH